MDDTTVLKEADAGIRQVVPGRVRSNDHSRPSSTPARPRAPTRNDRVSGRSGSVRRAARSRDSRSRTGSRRSSSPTSRRDAIARLEAEGANGRPLEAFLAEADIVVATTRARPSRHGEALTMDPEGQPGGIDVAPRRALLLLANLRRVLPCLRGAPIEPRAPSSLVGESLEEISARWPTQPKRPHAGGRPYDLEAR